MNLTLPPWVARWVGPEVKRRTASGLAWTAHVCHGVRLMQVSACIHDARQLSDEQLTAATTDAYLGIRELVGSHSLIRMWNGLPGILDEATELRDRYMVFNAGRHAAFQDWFGAEGPEAFAAAMPAATGVGHRSSDVIIHALADRQAGVAVENPRQQPAFRYSRRYGPQPPCFSRATRVLAPDGDKYLLVSGTASIVGEDSTHVDDLAAQLEETLTNIDALIVAAGGSGLQGLQAIRVYYIEPVTPDTLKLLLDERLGAHSVEIEFYPIVLCRANLMVEIEGLAAL